MKKPLLFIVLFLSTLSFISAQYSITPNNTYVTNGGGTWGSILKMKAYAINSGNSGRFKIYKSDGGNFTSSGIIYLRKGSYTGTNIASKNVTAGVTSVSIDLDFTNLSNLPNTVYAYYQPSSTSGFAWVGSISISQNTPQITSVSPNSATLGETVTFTIQGSNLTNNLVYYIPNFGSGTVNSSSSTTRKYFTTTSSYSNGVKNGEIKNQSGGTVLKTFQVNVTFPTPSNFSANAVSSSQINLSWNSVNGVYRYRLYRATSSNGSYSHIKTTSSTGYSNTGLSSNTTYYYKIKACQSSNSNSCSELSSYRSATTQNNSPVVTSVSPLTANINQEVTFTINGTNLISGMGFFVENLDNIQEQSGGNATVRYFKGTFQQYASTKSGIVKDAPSGNQLFAFSVDVVDNSPVVTSVSPLTANINQEVTFTINGTNLISGMGFFVENLDNIQEQSGGNATVRYFKGTFQQYASIKSGIVKDAPSGNQLFTFSVDVVDNSPVVTSVSPLTANINQEVTFTINGTNLTSGMGFFVENLDNIQEQSGGNATVRYFKGTFQQYASTKNGIVKDAPSGNQLFTFSVDVTDTSTCNYSDAQPSDWWYDAVQDLCARNLLDDDGSCEPTENLNRATLAKLTYLSINLQNNSFADDFPCPFNDLQNEADTWYYTYAKNLSYLEFTDNTASFDRDYFNFRPSETITRAHALKVLLEAWNIDETNNSGNNPYNDVTNSHESYNYILKAKDLGIINTDTSFRPNDPVLRAEIFVMLHRMLTVIALTIPTVNETDFFIPGNYTPTNFTSFNGMHSGNFNHYTKTSFAIASVGIPLMFEHSYNSYLSEIPDVLTPIKPLGRTWNHSFNSYIQEIEGDTQRPDDFRVIVALPNSGFQLYKKQGNNYVPETEGIYDELTKVNNTTFSITTKNQLVYTYKKLSGTDATFPFVLTTVSDRNNNTLIIAYENAYQNGFKRIKKVTGTAGRNITFFYHNNSDLVDKVSDPNSRTVYFRYNNGYLSSFIDAKSQTTLYNYGSGGAKEMLVNITLPKGNTITNTYNLKRLMSSKTNGNQPSQYNYHQNYGSNSGFYTKTTITDPTNKTITTQYNLKGNPTTITQDNTSLSFTYDSNHTTKIKTATYNGRTVNVTYDSNGNITQKQLPLNTVIKYEYNAKNDLTKFTDAKGININYGYNNTGNLTNITTVRGTTNMVVNAKGLITQITNPQGISVGFVYDNYGNRIQTNAPENITASTSYDILSRATSFTNPNNKTISYQFDKNDNLLQEIFNGQTTKYEVDANDNVTKIINAKNNATNLTYNANDDTLEQVSFGGANDVYTYFDNGNVKTYTNPKGIIFHYTYNNKSQLLSATANGNAISYTYNTRDLVKSVTNTHGSIEFLYDDLDHITSTTDYYGNTIGYEYDKNNNVTKLKYPNNKAVIYTYTDDNLLQSVTDWNNNTTSYTYRNDALLTAINYSNGTHCSYGYDTAGRMTSLVWKKSDNSIINNYTFTLDKVGNHLTETKTEPFGVIALNNEINNFTHNNRNELVTANGNTITHDQNGNLTNDGEYTNQFDIYDRLTNVSSASFNAQYQYDALGHRRKSVVNGNSKRFVLDILGLSKVLLETDNSNNVQNYYVYGLGLISRIDNTNTTHYYHDDFRGSIIALTDSNETITHKYQYTDFGEITQIEESNFNPYRYVGKHGIQFEAEKLYFMRARYYNPIRGRFFTEDPVWSTNLYPYAGNNPVMNVDPSGEIVITATVVAGVLIVAGGISAFDKVLGSILDDNLADKYQKIDRDKSEFYRNQSQSKFYRGGFEAAISGFVGVGLGSIRIINNARHAKKIIEIPKVIQYLHRVKPSVHKGIEYSKSIKYWGQKRFGVKGWKHIEVLSIKLDW